MMFPFPKLDNKTILIISVVLLLYVLTFEKTPDPIKKIIDKSSEVVNEVSTAANEIAITASTYAPGVSQFSQYKCAAGIPCDEDFTQEKDCPTLTEQLAKQVELQNKAWEDARNTGLPFPKDEGPTAIVDYIGKGDDTWFNDSQYATIQKIIEDPARQMKATQGNVVPSGGDTRAWPELYQTNQQVAALILQSLPTQGNNIQVNNLEA